MRRPDLLGFLESAPRILQRRTGLFGLGLNSPQRQFPELGIERVDPHTILAYLLSGGVSMRAFLPGLAATPLFRLEEQLGPLLGQLATMMTVELVRR